MFQASGRLWLLRPPVSHCGTGEDGPPPRAVLLAGLPLAAGRWSLLRAPPRSTTAELANDLRAALRPSTAICKLGCARPVHFDTLLRFNHERSQARV